MDAVDLPKAVIIPNMTQKSPPTIGSGMMMKIAPNLLTSPWMIISTAAHCMTRLDPTLFYDMLTLKSYKKYEAALVGHHFN